MIKALNRVGIEGVHFRLIKAICIEIPQRRTAWRPRGRSWVWSKSRKCAPHGRRRSAGARLAGSSARPAVVLSSSLFRSVGAGGDSQGIAGDLRVSWPRPWDESGAATRRLRRGGSRAPRSGPAGSGASTRRPPGPFTPQTTRGRRGLGALLCGGSQCVRGSGRGFVPCAAVTSRWP